MHQLFDAKPRNYTKPARRAESTYSFLDRTSLPEFERVRDMLTRWVARLPEAQQRTIVTRLRHKGRGSQRYEIQFNGAFFELFLHEFLQGTDGEVMVEPIFDGLTPDFQVKEELADGSQLTYVVEATDIDLARGTDLERAWNELEVLDALDEICSPDFRLFIQMEGKLKSLPPKAQLKRPFAKMVRAAKYEEVFRIGQEQNYNPTNLPKASFQYGDWTIVGHLWPVLPEYRGRTKGIVGASSMGGGYLDDIGKTKDRLYEKARRYSSVENLIIALRCDVSNKRLDEVLFGSQQFTIYVNNDASSTTPPPEPHQSQRMNGFWFNSSGPINRHVIGIVAYYGVHPWALDRSTAVFYSNPYLQGPMPAWTKLIHHAEYTDGEVSTSEGVPPYTFLRDYVTIGSPFG